MLDGEIIAIPEHVTVPAVYKAVPAPIGSGI
jgi:hypothetical protein